MDGTSERKAKRQAIEINNKNLNANNSDQVLWLVKLPDFLAEALATANQDDVLGSVAIKANSSAPGGKQMMIKLDSNKFSDVPDQYILHESKSSSISAGESMFAFNIDNEQSQFVIDGKVTKSFYVTSDKSADYRRATTKGEKKTNILIEEGDIDLQRPRLIESISHTRTELKRKAASKSSVPLDVPALKSKIFEAFEKEPVLPFKVLLDFCKNVPGLVREDDLRNELEKYARYNKQGAYRGCWSLQSQYRTSSSSAQEEKM
jgi:hypothetical protein